MYKLICSLVASIVGFLVRSQPALPLAVEWVLHYIRGSQTPKTLPGWAQGECEYYIVEALKERYCRKMGMRNSLVGYIGNDDPEDSWWGGLQGVVGQFNFRVLLTEYGVVYQAYDVWDFNLGGEPGSAGVRMETPFKSLPNFSLLGGAISLVDGQLRFHETWLSQFNSRHAFDTCWDGLLDWDNFPSEVYEAWAVGDKTNPKYPHTSKCGNYTWITRSTHWGYPGGEAAWRAVFEAPSLDEDESGSSWNVDYSDDE